MGIRNKGIIAPRRVLARYLIDIAFSVGTEFNGTAFVGSRIEDFE
jgi:hypothetical protein